MDLLKRNQLAENKRNPKSMPPVVLFEFVCKKPTNSTQREQVIYHILVGDHYITFVDDATGKEGICSRQKYCNRPLLLHTITPSSDVDVDNNNNNNSYKDDNSNDETSIPLGERQTSY